LKQSENIINDFYILCDYCLKRNNTAKILFGKYAMLKDHKTTSTDNSGSNCFICRGLFDLIEEIVKEITFLISIKNKYEFDSYSLGSSLPAHLFDNEDHFRSLFQLRGEESIKSAFNHAVRNNFEKVLKKPLKIPSPDMLINLSISHDLEFSVDFQTRPYYLICRYTKKKLMHQRKIKCDNCEGRGCTICNLMKNNSQKKSIEMIIKRHLMNFTSCDNVNFTWMGGEDQNSMVLGKGRFFIAQIINPKKRKIKKNIIFQEDGIIFKIKEKKESIKKYTINYISKTKAYVKTLSPINNLNLLRLIQLKNSTIKYRNKTKIVQRRIYKISVKRLDEYDFVVTVLSDGGLFIKQFIEGKDWIEPNVSSYIGNKCTCIKFDVLDITTA
jgi:tRNA pseudouridine synthase 10